MKIIKILNFFKCPKGIWFGETINYDKLKEYQK